MKWIHVFILAGFLFGILGCKSKIETVEQAAIDLRPSWVKSRPIVSGSYVGIASARKVTGSTDHITIARNQALSALAGEISLQVSGSSLLNQMENSSQYSERFQSNIRTKTAKFLEGYELQDVYETEFEYWVYYTLDRNLYQKLQNQKREQAISLSVELFKEAESYYNNGNDILAIEQYLKALESIGDFWNEPLQTEIDGKNVFLGNLIFTNLSKTIRGLDIKPIKNEVEWIRGSDLPSDLLTFEVRSHTGILLSDVPIFMSLEGIRLMQQEFFTKRNGQVSLNQFIDDTERKTSRLSATLNMVSVINRSTRDPLIGIMANAVRPPEGSLELIFIMPTVYLSGSELYMGQARPNMLVREAFESALFKDNFSISTNSNADFYIEISLTAQNGGSVDRFVSVFLNGRIRVTNKQGRLVHEIKIDNVKGVQVNYERAVNDAFDKVSREVERRYFRDIKRAMLSPQNP